MNVLKRNKRINKVIFSGIILLVFLCMLILCSAVILFTSTQIRKSIMSNIAFQGKYYAENIENKLSLRYDIAKNMTNILIAARSNLGESFRYSDVIDIIDAYFRNDNSPQTVGYWVYLRTGLFHPEDFAEYGKKNSPEDEFVFYSVYKNNDHIESNLSFKDRILEEYYARPFNSGKVYISDPYISHGVYIISIAFPVVFNGKVAGSLGADLRISEINTMISNLNVEDDGYARLISNNKIVLADGRNIDYAGESLVGNEQIFEAGRKASLHEVFSFTAKNTLNDDEEHRLVIPVEISDSDLHWLVEIVLPEKAIQSKVLDSVFAVLEVVILVMIFAVGVAVLFGFYVNNAISIETDWYRSVLDSIEYPVCVLDNNKKLCYKNKFAEDTDEKIGKSSGNGNLLSGTGYEFLQNKPAVDSDSTDSRWSVHSSLLTDKSGMKIGEILVIKDQTFSKHVHRMVNTINVMISAMLEEDRMCYDKLTDIFESLNYKIVKLEMILYEATDNDLYCEDDYIEDFVDTKISMLNSVVDDMRKCIAKLNFIKLNLSLEEKSDNADSDYEDSIIGRLESIKEFSNRVVDKILLFNEDMAGFIRSEYSSFQSLIKDVKLLKNELDYMNSTIKEVKDILLKRLQDYEHIKFELEHIKFK